MVLLLFLVIIKSSTAFGKMTVMQRVMILPVEGGPIGGIVPVGVDVVNVEGSKSFGHVVLIKVALIGLISPKKMGEISMLTMCKGTKHNESK